MLAALQVLLGFQLVLAFLTHDMQSVPRVPIHNRLHSKRANDIRGKA
jgi:dolichol-phosphate mannosyltransferase